jgi:steroid 5-alpha reductase family enzyme
VDIRTQGRPVKFSDLIAVSSASALAIVAVHLSTFLIGRRIGRYNVVDVAWGIGFIAVAAIAAVLGDGDATRRWLLAVLVAIWGLRLSWHMYRKSAGKGEDLRYADLLGDDPPIGRVLARVFLLQGCATWFVSLPLQSSATTGPTGRSWLIVTVAGICLWAVGLVFEAVGDHQLRVFKANPAHRGVVLDRGLWACTRHPNYFGDACLWWGLWLTTITGWWSIATVLSPLLMTYLLVYATGARLTEKYMAGRPGFDQYRARTPFFIPRPRGLARR